MATIPRLDIPSTMNKPGPWVVQHINPSSDGSPSSWRGPPYRAISNDVYRVKVGKLWAEQKGIATPGKSARLRVAYESGLPVYLLSERQPIMLDQPGVHKLFRGPNQILPYP